MVTSAGVNNTLKQLSIAIIRLKKYPVQYSIIKANDVQFNLQKKQAVSEQKAMLYVYCNVSKDEALRLSSHHYIYIFCKLVNLLLFAQKA